MAGSSNIYLTGSNKLKNTYSVETYYDPQGDKLGHIPFTISFPYAIKSLTTLNKVFTLAARWLKPQTENAPSSDRTYSNIRIQVESVNKQALRAYLP